MARNNRRVDARIARVEGTVCTLSLINADREEKGKLGRLLRQTLRAFGYIFFGGVLLYVALKTFQTKPKVCLEILLVRRICYWNYLGT